MDEKHLIRTINTGAHKAPRRKWNCLSEERFAAYLGQRLDTKGKYRFEAHLADCDFCMGMLGALVRQQRASEPADAPARLLEKAVNKVAAKTSWGISQQWVLAAALVTVVFAAAFLLRLPRPRKFVASVSAPATEKAQSPVALLQPPPQRPKEQEIRKLESAAPAVYLLEPRPESVVRREGLQFRWKPVGNTAYYELWVVDSEGELVWQRKESYPNAQLPPNLAVQPGKYFVWVRAYLHDGRTLKSEPVPFTIASSK